jgi:hypothetical protein
VASECGIRPYNAHEAVPLAHHEKPERLDCQERAKYDYVSHALDIYMPRGRCQDNSYRYASNGVP